MMVWNRIYLFFIISLAWIAGCSGPAEPDFPRILLFFNEDEINYESKEYIEAQIRWHGHSHLDLAKAKLRGGWSRIYPKNSFTVNLQADPSIPIFSRDNDWILSASYVDKTMIRHTLSYELFKKMTGLETSAPNTEYVEVFINHNYHGLYLLHPRVDRSYLDLQKSGALFKDPPVFFKGELPPPEEAGNPWHRKYPKEEEDITLILDTVRQRLMYADLCDFDTVSTYFDVDHIIDWHLLLLVTHGSDGLMKNFYLYRRTKEDPFRFCLWDYDHSFGRDGDYELNRDTTVLDISRNWLLEGMSQCPEYQEKLTDKYEVLRSSVLSTKAIIDLADSLYYNNRDAIYRNGERWPWDSEHYSDDNTADEEIELLRDFIRRKMVQLDELMI